MNFQEFQLHLVFQSDGHLYRLSWHRGGMAFTKLIDYSEGKIKLEIE